MDSSRSPQGQHVGGAARRHGSLSHVAFPTGPGLDPEAEPPTHSMTYSPEMSEATNGVEPSPVLLPLQPPLMELVDFNFPSWNSNAADEAPGLVFEQAPAPRLAAPPAEPRRMTVGSSLHDYPLPTVPTAASPIYDRGNGVVLPPVPLEVLIRVRERRRSLLQQAAAVPGSVPPEETFAHFAHFMASEELAADPHVQSEEGSLFASSPQSLAMNATLRHRDSPGSSIAGLVALGNSRTSRFGGSASEIAHVFEGRRRSNGSWEPRDVAMSMSRQSASSPLSVAHSAPRKSQVFEGPELFDLPLEIIRFIVDYYLPIREHNTLRLVNQRFDQLVTSNCTLWHRRLPIMFETEEGETGIVDCRLHRVITGVHMGEVPLSVLASTYCFGGCCYRAWFENKLLLHRRMEEEKVEQEKYAFASQVFQALYFPSMGSTCLGLLFMITGALLVGLFLAFAFVDMQPSYLTFLPLWGFYALCYPLIYLFYCNSTIEPLVLSIIISIGVNLSTILLFFYRIASGQAAMSWISCLTPTLLCFACGATYAFLLAHRSLRQGKSSKPVVVLTVLTTIAPVLFLCFMALLAAELDGDIVLPPSARPDSSAGSGDGKVYGSVRPSGIALLCTAAVVIADLIYSLRVVGIVDLWVEEPLATVVALGFLLSTTLFGVLGVAISVNAPGLPLFVLLAAAVGTFFFTMVLNAGFRKNNFAYRIQLFPLTEL